MWIVVRLSDNAVVGTSYSTPPDGAWNTILFDVKEWTGPEPLIHDPEESVESYDPTLTDPDYPAFLQSKVDFGALADKADAEIDWLETNIPLVDDMTLEELRTFLKRVARENQEEIKAWRYLFRRLAS